MRVSTVLDQIDMGGIALPEFQRGYVWNRDQVRSLMDSLYRKYPVGGLLVWHTKTETADARGDGPMAVGTVKLLLDGQQRITTLYGIIRGKPPLFFEGNAQAFTNLYFHLADEAFEFYAPLKMNGNPMWISVSELMRQGIGPYIMALGTQVPPAELPAYITRLNRLETIKEIEFHIEEVTGEQMTVDVVVDIFNKVNSGGTKLSKGDLALAKICASWPQARDEMNTRLKKWQTAGYQFRMEWLLRVINATVTGESLFTALKDVDTAEFQQGLKQAEKHVDLALNLIASRLGLDHGDVLQSVFAIPVIARYTKLRGGHLSNHKERDRLLYWYIHTLLWGRYAGSTESVLSQDLHHLSDIDSALDRLIDQLRLLRGDLRIRPEDFHTWSVGSRFYPLLYMLTRVWKARDWDSGIELSAHLLGVTSRLQLHHIFPKARLYEAGYSRPEVNALSNFTFLTQATNLQISDKDPAVYLEEIAARNPGVLESHWIPMDRDLWKIANYRAFLAARRALLAKAANEFLDSLLAGSVPHVQSPAPTTDTLVGDSQQPAAEVLTAEERTLRYCNELAISHGLPAGEFHYELADPATGERLAIIDLAWPEGLQQQYSSPVAVLIDEDGTTEEIVNGAGFRFFTDATAFRAYLEREILALDVVPQ